LRWSCDFFLCFCLYAVFHSLVCIYWTIPASLEWNQLDHGMILLICCWMWFLSNLLRNFASKFIKEICLFSVFCCCCILDWCWDECKPGFIEWIWQCSFPFYFVEKLEESWY
jgi:hypothetical protein